jgi:histidine kinase
LGQGLGEIETLRAGRPIPELIDLPLMTDPDAYMAKLLLTVFATPAYFLYNDTIWVWTIIQLVKISMRDGHSDISDLGYSAFGVLLGPGMGDYPTGYDYGRLADRLNRKFNKVENRAKVNLIFGLMIAHWRDHIKHSMPLALEGFQTGQETGDLIYAGYNAYSLVWANFCIGRPLHEVVAECQKFQPFFNRTKDLLGQGIVVLQRMAEALQGQTDAPTSLENAGQTEAALTAPIVDYALKLPIHVYYLAKMRLHYLFGEYEKALEYVAPAQAVMYASTGYVYYADTNFLHSLVLLALTRTAGPETRAAHLSTVEANQLQLKKWADNAPDNYAHKYALIEAEQIAFTDDKRAASDGYDEAIRQAHERGFLHDEALTNELAGRYYLDIGKPKLARPYLQDAHQLYLKWGATAKAQQLKTLYPEQIPTPTRRSSIGTIHPEKSSSGESSDALDLYSIMKAYTAISGEVALDKLLRRMITVIVENAGAQRAVLLRADDHNRLYVTAEGSSLEQALYLGSGERPLADAGDLLSSAVVQYVALTKTEVVLADAARDDRFGETPYIKAKQPKSVLGLPILHQGKIAGIMYLENNLTHSAFTSERVEVLRLLSAQMAVSIENALLYRNLEQKVQERTQIIHLQKEEIEVEKQKSEKLLFNILPVSIAEELRENGFATPKSFDNVTVMFTDFSGFTQVAEKISPQELIQILNECFSAFDQIAIRHNLESIKTIGDAYMCAGGVPTDSPSHPSDTVQAALEIQSFVRDWNVRRIAAGEPTLHLRIGIHTGPVIAGVVGIRKFAYDIWGDAVNIASRMESSGDAGKINISGSTYALVKDRFACTHRGKIEAKNKGMIDMYFVEV